MKAGDVASPRLFCMVLDAVLRHVREEWECDRLGDIPLRPLFFADDGLLLGWSEEVVQKGLDLVARFCADVGLTLSVQKTMAASSQELWKHFSDEAYEARLGHPRQGYVRYKEKKRRTVECQRCGSRVRFGGLGVHYRSKYCRRHSHGRGTAARLGAVDEAGVRRGAGNRACVDMPPTSSSTTKCPFPWCRARFADRVHMQTHMRWRHVEQAGCSRWQGALMRRRHA